MIRTFLAALLLFCSLATFASAAPPDDPGRDSAVTDSASVSHASVTLDDSAPCDAPAGTSPMLASVGLLGVAGVAGGSLLAFRPGDRVTYVDEKGQAHAALVKSWMGASEHAACDLSYVDDAEQDGSGLVRSVRSVSRGNSQMPCPYWLPDVAPVSGAFADSIPAPPPVTGYRQLTPEDVVLMNETKAAVNALGAVLDKLAAHPDTDKRWLAIARTDAQTSCMAACHAITRPSSFA